MRRFRRRRGRVAALVLLPLAGLTTTMTSTFMTSTFASSVPDQGARISSSDARVAYGDRVTLRGAFPGAIGAPVEIHHRAKGAGAWRLEGRATTNARGRYAVRVKPRRSGYWRAELATPPQAAAPTGTPQPVAQSATVDGATPAERVIVRSRTRARVADRHALAGEDVRIRGRVAPAGARRRVVIAVGGDRVTTRAARDGRFSAAWKAPDTGTYKVRVRAKGNRIAAGSGDRAGRVTVYRRASASWYGPGLYGNRTACGQTLTPTIVGVAHKTLPCGTKLRLRYDNRTAAVRVIDRGPYAGDRELDLTYAAKQNLGFGSTGTVLTSR